MSIVDITSDPVTDPEVDVRSGAVTADSLDLDGPAGDWDPAEIVGLDGGLAGRPPGDSAGVEPVPTEGIPTASAAAARGSAMTQDTAQPSVPGTRPTFTITDAATACAVSRKTITRKLSDLAEHGAAKDEDGVWRIPVEALLAVGLHPGRSLPPPSRASAGRTSIAPTSTPTAPATPVAAATARTAPPTGAELVTIPRDRWDDLRLRLARAEAEAAERGLALADARLALRALTAAPPTAPAAPAAPAESDTVGPTAPQPVPSTAPVPGTSSVPPAAGWVMGPMPTVIAPGHEATPQAAVRADPGAAPPLTAAAPQPRKRRWWQSAAN